MNLSEDSWKNRSYQELLGEAVRVELANGSLPQSDEGHVTARFEDLVMSCSFIQQPSFAAFAEFFSQMCGPRMMHPLTVEHFLRAAWKACDDDAKGIRPIPGRVEAQLRARELRRALILDTEESWAYEGLDVKFRSDLEPGEDPAVLAVSYGTPSRFSIAELEKGIREHIENGGLEAYFASARADFEANRQRQQAE